jgi:hypothetical protein
VVWVGFAVRLGLWGLMFRCANYAAVVRFSTAVRYALAADRRRPGVGVAVASSARPQRNTWSWTLAPVSGRFGGKFVRTGD